MRSDVHALLIGIDHYFPSSLPDCPTYPSLTASTRDVAAMERFLLDRTGVPECNLTTLTATNTGEKEPPEPRDRWPTHRNIKAAWRRLIDEAAPGDQVLIHYSGHGGRVPTRHPKLKENGLDETLVPLDVGRRGGQHLRDVEIAWLVKTMVRKELYVTLVLDCCHSGGATRGKRGPVARGIPGVDRTPRPWEELIAPEADLGAAWGEPAPRTKTRGMVPADRSAAWHTYAALAACRPWERAWEHVFEGRRHGALTFWLLDALERLPPGATYQQVYDLVSAKIRSEISKQTPMLFGHGSRVVLGQEEVRRATEADDHQPGRRPERRTVAVVGIEEATGRVLLATGRAHGLEEGARFAIYPRGADPDAGQPAAQVEIVQAGAADSWAEVVDGAAAIEPGLEAVLLAPAQKLQGVVHLEHRPDLPRASDQDLALARVESLLKRDTTGFVRLAEAAEAVDFQVAVNDQDEYEIWDRTGEPVPNLRPPLRIADPVAPSKLVQRLVHLTKYRNVLQLQNPDETSPLWGKLHLELLGVQERYREGASPQPEPFDPDEDLPTIAAGQWTFLRITNLSSRNLHVTVLDLAPDWEISRVHPPVGGAAFAPLDREGTLTVALQGSLPQGLAEGTDVLKVFATLQPTDFRVLELPPLDRPATRRVTRGSAPSDPLGQLFAALAAKAPAKRGRLTVSEFHGAEWVTGQVEVRVRQAARPSGQRTGVLRGRGSA